MLAFLRGTILAKLSDSLIVELHDVGYRVFVPVPLRDRLHAGEAVELYCHEVIRDDRRELFGVSTLGALRLFHQLITVSGVGPKSALGILGLGTPQDIEQAIARGDVAYLSKVVGIGRKTAERIVIELKEKCAVDAATGATATGDVDAEIVDALTQLGYRIQEVREVIRALPSAPRTTEERLKSALQVLGKR